MKIEVVGNCCASCHSTYNAIRQAAADIDCHIEVIHVESIADILRLGVVQMPTVIVDGRTISAGQHYTKADAASLILQLKANG